MLSLGVMILVLFFGVNFSESLIDSSILSPLRVYAKHDCIIASEVEKNGVKYLYTEDRHLVTNAFNEIFRQENCRICFKATNSNRNRMERAKIKGRVHR